MEPLLLKKPLKIALIKTTLHSYGGLEKYCVRLLRALEERGHQVAILSTSSRDDVPVEQVCRRLRPSALNLVWFDYHCRRYVRRHHFDVVVGLDRHFLPLTLYRAGNGCHAAYLARRCTGASLLKRVSLFLNPLHLLTLYSERCTFERHPPVKIICNSHLVAAELLRYYPKTPSSRIAVLHNGVEWEEFAPYFQQKLSAPADSAAPPELLFIGHEWGRKGLDRLLQALSLIKDRPFHLTAVGKERHPEVFESLARALNIRERVTFVPTAQAPMPYYQRAHIAVLPSRYDPFANVTLEALAMGLFVVTTTANGGSEVITPRTNGLIVDEMASSQELSEAIALALDRMQDPALPSSIRESVREYDFSQTLREYISLIKLTVRKPSP